jgi:hypothetical protein
MMVSFLRQRSSTLPDKLALNSWAVFTNPHNLDKYERAHHPRP